MDEALFNNVRHYGSARKTCDDAKTGHELHLQAYAWHPNAVIYV